jgi:hypothetical protein
MIYTVESVRYFTSGYGTAILVDFHGHKTHVGTERIDDRVVVIKGTRLRDDPVRRCYVAAPEEGHTRE